MSFGNTPTTTTQGTLATNQIPIGSVAEPGRANGDLTTLEGGPGSVDSNSNRTAPASMYIKDGNNVTQGLKADTAATDSTSSWSAIALLKGLYAKLASTLTISGAVTTSGTVTEANSAASKADLDTIVTNTNKIPASPAQEGGNLATLAGIVSSSKAAVKAASGDFADGSLVAIGTTTQTKATDGTTTSWSVIQLLKGIFDKLLGSIAVTGTFWQATQPVSGTITANEGGTWTVQPGNTANTTPWLTQEQAGTAGGSTPYHLLSAASNNATSLKASAGQLYGYSFSNTNAAARWVKFYNKASAPAPATDTVVWAEQVPGNGTIIATIPEGMVFATGIAFAAVVNASDTDNTSVGAGDLSIDIRYK